MSQIRKKLLADSKRRRVETLKNQGFSVSRISKLLGISYKHCKNLFNQTPEEEDG